MILNETNYCILRSKRI